MENKEFEKRFKAWQKRKMVIAKEMAGDCLNTALIDLEIEKAKILENRRELAQDPEKTLDNAKYFLSCAMECLMQHLEGFSTNYDFWKLRDRMTDLTDSYEYSENSSESKRIKKLAAYICDELFKSNDVQ